MSPPAARALAPAVLLVLLLSPAAPGGGEAAAARGAFTSDFDDLSGIAQSDHVRAEGGFLKLNSSGSGWPVPTGESAGSYWRYTTSSPSGSWTSAGYDDSGWSSGEAPFGKDYNTNLNPRTPWTSSNIWIRRAFDAGFSPSDASRMMLRYWHDEGVEVYLNGQSLFSEGGYVDRYIDLVLDSAKLGLLQSGKNVLSAHCSQTIYAQGIDLGLQVSVRVTSGNATSVAVQVPAGERLSSFDADFSAGGTAEALFSILNATTLNPFPGLYMISDLPADLGALKATAVRVRFHLSTTGTDIPQVRSWTVAWTPDVPYMAAPIPDNLTLPEDSDLPRALDLSAYFRDDLCPQPALRYSVDFQSAPEKLSASVTGAFLDIATPAPDWFGKASFRVRCTNGYHSVASNTFNVTVTSVNDPPAMAPVPALRVMQDAALSYRFTATDADVGTDPAERLTFSTNTTGIPLSPSGWLNLTPGNDMVGVHLFTVTVRDRAGATDSVQAVLTVVNVNDPPSGVAVTAPSDGASFNEHVNITLRAAASDPDGDPLSFVWRDADGAVIATGAQAAVLLGPGVHYIHVEVSDGNATVSSGAVSVRVANVNDPPEGVRVLLPVNGSVYNERAPVVFRACATDPDGDRLEFSWTLADGTLLGAGAEFCTTGLPPGKHVVRLEVSDGSLKVRPPAVEITINNINDPPRNVAVLYPANGTVTAKGEPVTFSCSADDPDGDALNFTWRDGKGNVVGYGREFTTARLPAGTHLVRVDVSDGGFTVSSGQVSVRVKPPPAPGKGFIPGPGAAWALAAILLWALALRRRNG